MEFPEDEVPEVPEVLEPPGPELVPADGDEEVPAEPEVVVLVPGVLEVVPDVVPDVDGDEEAEFPEELEEFCLRLSGAVITALCPPGAEELLPEPAGP